MLIIVYMKLELIRDVLGQPYIAMVFSPSRNNTAFIESYLDRLKAYIDKLYGGELNDAVNHVYHQSYYDVLIKNKELRDGKDHWHITVFNSMECKKYPYLLLFDGIYISTDNVCHGIGTIFRAGEIHEQTYYLVMENKELDSLAVTHELTKRHYHLTLGFDPKDLFHAPKNIETIIIPALESEEQVQD